jgi:peroxiredoxin (alkyl hydroperoxide reductase subunit C)
VRIQLHSRVHDRALRVRARAPEFDKFGVQLIGLSIDSVNSHIAWIRNIEQRFGVKVKYPLIADLDMKVAQKYGMIHPGAATTTTVRCVSVIDDEGMLKAKAWPPRRAGSRGTSSFNRPRLR